MTVRIDDDSVGACELFVDELLSTTGVKLVDSPSSPGRTALTRRGSMALESVREAVRATSSYLAFVGLERTGGTMVYDVSNPFHLSFVQYVNTSPEDISPEGLLFIKEADSPNGKPLLVVLHEISSTTTIFEINKTSPTFLVAERTDDKND